MIKGFIVLRKPNNHVGRTFTTKRKDTFHIEVISRKLHDAEQEEGGHTVKKKNI